MGYIKNIQVSEIKPLRTSLKLASKVLVSLMSSILPSSSILPQSSSVLLTQQSALSVPFLTTTVQLIPGCTIKSSGEGLRYTDAWPPPLEGWWPRHLATSQIDLKCNQGWEPLDLNLSRSSIWFTYGAYPDTSFGENLVLPKEICLRTTAELNMSSLWHQRKNWSKLLWKYGTKFCVHPTFKDLWEKRTCLIHSQS